MGDFYILVNDQESGPFALQELDSMIEHGEIPPETLYSRPGMSAWEQLSNVVRTKDDLVNESSDKNLPLSEMGVLLNPNPPPTQYGDSSFESLMRKFERLTTYAAVNEWDPRAKAEVKMILEVIRSLDVAISIESAALAQAKLEFEQRSFWKQVFGNHDSENLIASRLSGLRQRKIRLLQMIAELQNAVDFTPNTPEEKEVLVKELHHRKKELTAQKRQATAAMTAIRQEARVKSVHAGETLFGFYDSSLAADQRRGIRYAKEAALKPQEDAKMAIERQLIRIEKDLLWIEQIE